MQDSIEVDPNYNIKIFNCEFINQVPWSDLDVDVVIEASGLLINYQKSIESINTLPKVLFTYAHKDLESIILGVNDRNFNKEKRLYSASICDAVALAPLYKIIDETYCIVSGHLITLHSWLSYQNLLDGPAKSWSLPGDVLSHYSLGRSAVGSVIPKNTSALTAVSYLLPEASKKLDSFSYRIPTPNVSSATLIVNTESSLKSIDVNSLLKQYSENNHLIMKVTNEPLISVDYSAEPYSLIIDSRWTTVTGGNSIKIVYWYDNEWGYVHHLKNIIKLL